ncbi:MAG: hypothetical protein EP338_12665 [Bacteroidetes bacterium]|nr:MAG: hypothetical protein EP338_12665 [Bacteroidota bacterium]
MSDILDGGSSSEIQGNKTLPNATATLVLGIISLATFWLYGVIGIICGIIALALHPRDKRLYQEDPAAYQQSYKTARAGYICGLIGLIISVLFLIFVIAFVFIFVQTMNNAVHDFR